MLIRRQCIHCYTQSWPSQHQDAHWVFLTGRDPYQTKGPLTGRHSYSATTQDVVSLGLYWLPFIDCLVFLLCVWLEYPLLLHNKLPPLGENNHFLIFELWTLLTSGHSERSTTSPNVHPFTHRRVWMGESAPQGDSRLKQEPRTQTTCAAVLLYLHEQRPASHNIFTDRGLQLKRWWNTICCPRAACINNGWPRSDNVPRHRVFMVDPAVIINNNNINRSEQRLLMVDPAVMICIIIMYQSTVY